MESESPRLQPPHPLLLSSGLPKWTAVEAADAAVSLGVVLAGLGIILTGELWIDPAMSLIVAGVILVGTWGLLRESTNLVLQAVPTGIDLDNVREYLENLPGVERVHDLHVWAMSTTENVLTAHLVKPDPEDDDDLLATASHDLQERFRIGHVTIQIERDAAAARCRQAADDAV